MELKEFLERLLQDVNGRIPAGRTAHYTKVDKNNNTSYTGMYLSAEQRSAVSPILYMEPLYERMQAGEITYEEIVSEVTVLIMKPGADRVDLEPYLKTAYARDHIVFRLFGKKENEQLLANLLYRDVANMAMTYAVYIDDDTIGVGLAPVTEGLAKEYGMTEEECFRRAMENTPRLLPLRILDLAAACGAEHAPASKAGAFLVVSNDQAFYGAGAALYPGVLNDMAEQCGQDLYLVPSSVHEMIAVPAEENAIEALYEVFFTITKTELKPADVLTETIYRYHRESGEITVVKPPEELSGKWESRSDEAGEAEARTVQIL